MILDDAISLAETVGILSMVVLAVLCVVRRNLRRASVLSLLALWCAYTLAYTVLSINGRYEPAMIGLSGVKWYEWAPRGFVHNYNWNVSMKRTFLVYYFLDTTFWHKYGRLDELGDRPVNEVKPENIWDVYRAWDPKKPNTALEHMR